LKIELTLTHVNFRQNPAPLRKAVSLRGTRRFAFIVSSVVQLTCNSLFLQINEKMHSQPFSQEKRYATMFLKQEEKIDFKSYADFSKFLGIFCNLALV
jgi:hypothetical protein